LKRLSLSVLVPVYNERYLVEESLARLGVLAKCPWISRVQVIVVDDCSTDGSREILRKLARRPRARGRMQWIFLEHEKNSGKGAAVRTALARAEGELSIVHDADLEYHPEDIPDLLLPFLNDHADAVYGSRFRPKRYSRALFFRHQLGNNLLTLCSNFLSNYNISDMETCYKAVRTDLLKSIPLESDDFRMEVELTQKLAKRNARLFEAPISYSGRTYQEGKKINWRDGFRAFQAMLKYSLSDNVFPDDDHGSRILARLSRAPRFNQWMSDVIRPFAGRRVLEIGAGIGNMSTTLLPRDLYWATDINPHYLPALKALSLNRPYLHSGYCDVTRSGQFPKPKGGFDTVVCLNVMEHIEDDSLVMKNLAAALAPGGRAIVLVPRGAWAYGSLDEVLGHVRRYDKGRLRSLAGEAGLEVEALSGFNRIGIPAWLLNGKLLRRRHFGLMQIWALNLLTPLFRLLEPILPWPGLSLILVARKPER
jgi:glycosyltransferase involved in cell wall biosynthesis